MKKMPATVKVIEFSPRIHFDRSKPVKVIMPPSSLSMIKTTPYGTIRTS